MHNEHQGLWQSKYFLFPWFFTFEPQLTPGKQPPAPALAALSTPSLISLSCLASPLLWGLPGQGAHCLPAARGALSVEILPFCEARNLIMLLIKARCWAWEIYFLFHICGCKCHSGSSKAHVSLNQVPEQTFCSQLRLLSPSSSVSGRKCVLWYPPLTPISLALFAPGEREGGYLGSMAWGENFPRKLF